MKSRSSFLAYITNCTLAIPMVRTNVRDQWYWNFFSIGVYYVRYAYAYVCRVVGWPLQDTHNANSFDGYFEN